MDPNDEEQPKVLPKDTEITPKVTELHTEASRASKMGATGCQSYPRSIQKNLERLLGGSQLPTAIYPLWALGEIVRLRKVIP